MADEPEQYGSLGSLLDEWQAQARGRPLRILVGGKAGAGKSALINNLLREELCEEGFGADGVTTCVGKFEVMMKGIRIQIFDTPGLEDISSERSEESIVAEMSAAVKDEASDELDLFFYCKSILERLTNEDRRMLRLLTLSFGKDLWERAVIVLTMANIVNTRQKSSYQEKVESYGQRVKSILKEKLKVDESIVRNILVRTAGYKDPVIPCEASGRPDEDPNWRLRLIEAAMYRANPSCVPALVDVTFAKTMSVKKVLAGGGAGFTVSVAMGAAAGVCIGAAVPVGGLLIGPLAGAAIGATVVAPAGTMIGAGAGSISTVIQHKFMIWKMKKGEQYRYKPQAT